MSQIAFLQWVRIELASGVDGRMDSRRRWREARPRLAKVRINGGLKPAAGTSGSPPARTAGRAFERGDSIPAAAAPVAPTKGQARLLLDEPADGEVGNAAGEAAGIFRAEERVGGAL
ncbi:MAG TPA: hypothetical protein VF771_00255, partial [Longimicrobiaceae bacterium]